MPNKNPIPVRTKQQIAKEQNAQELLRFNQLNRLTRRNRREAAHAEEKAQLRDALDRSERRNVRQRERNAEQRAFERRRRIATNTIRHLVILLTFGLFFLNDLADPLICIPAIAVMLFAVGFDVAWIWTAFISRRVKKSGGK